MTNSEWYRLCLALYIFAIFFIMVGVWSAGITLIGLATGMALGRRCA